MSSFICQKEIITFVVVQLLSCVQLFGLQSPHELQHTRFPWPSQSLGVCSNSHPLSQWYHPTISSSVVPFSSCFQSFLVSESFPGSRLFTSGGQSIGVSASTTVLLMNIQDGFPLGLTGLISLLSKDSQESSPVWQFENISSSVHNLLNGRTLQIHTWLLEKPEPWLDGPLLAK